MHSTSLYHFAHHVKTPGEYNPFTASLQEYHAVFIEFSCIRSKILSGH